MAARMLAHGRAGRSMERWTEALDTLADLYHLHCYPHLLLPCNSFAFYIKFLARLCSHLFAPLLQLHTFHARSARGLQRHCSVTCLACKSGLQWLVHLACMTCIPTGVIGSSASLQHVLSRLQTAALGGRACTLQYILLAGMYQSFVYHKGLQAGLTAENMCRVCTGTPRAVA